MNRKRVGRADARGQPAQYPADRRFAVTADSGRRAARPLIWPRG